MQRASGKDYEPLDCSMTVASSLSKRIKPHFKQGKNTKHSDKRHSGCAVRERIVPYKS